MGVIRKYLKQRFHYENMLLEYDNPVDFYVSCWQKSLSPLPLLVLRTFLFLLSLSIIIASIVINIVANYGNYWIIYMTHWGLIMNTLATGLALAVSAKCYFGEPFDGVFGLPWYVKLYWISSNIATTMALLITIFYWAFLTEVEVVAGGNVLAIDEVLNVFIHAINSVCMMLHLLSSQHETRFLHVLHPWAFAAVYCLFSGIYYVAGGTNGFGYNWIYPTLDWSQPGVAVVMVAFTTALIVVLHAAVAGVATGRNALARRLKGSSNVMTVN